MTDANVTVAAKRKERAGIPKQSAIRRGSGGIGKNDASASARTNKAGTPYGVSAQ
jgi:hypothetical protein